MLNYQKTLVLGIILSLFMNFKTYSQEQKNLSSGIEKNTLSINGNPLEIFTLYTGNIQIHSCHYENCKKEKSPYILRFLKILKDTSHVEPIPINVFLIKHPEGNFVIDAGGDPQWYDESSWACEPFSRKIAQKLANVNVKPEESLESRLNQLGLKNSDIQAAIVTHLHFDHTAGLKKLNAPTYVGKGDIKNGRIIGSVPCKFLDGVKLIKVEPLLKGLNADKQDIGDSLLGAGLSLTKDNAIKVYSTPGHTPGSLTIRVRTDQGDLWFVGDITFEDTQIETNSKVAGIHFNIKEIRKLHKNLKLILSRTKSILIPAHQVNTSQRIKIWSGK